MKKINILEIVGEIDGGGVGSVVYNYLSHMDLTNFNVDILAFNNEKNEYGQKQLLHDNFTKLGVHIYYFDHRNKGYKDHFTKYSSLLEERNYDIVHCHFGIWSTPYLSRAKKAGVRARIAHSHVSNDEYHGIKMTVLNLSKVLLNHYVTDRFACGIAAGQYLWGKKEFYVMNNAIDTDKFKFNSDIRNKIREQYNIQNDQLCLGNVGRFCYQKNQKFIIRLLKKLKDDNVNFSMMFIGDGEDINEVKSLAKDYGVDQYCNFIGLVNNVNDYLNAMDLFFLPSNYEGLPVVAIEAQANGLPVYISSNVTSEVLLLDQSKSISLENSREWIKAIEGFKENEEERLDGINVITKQGYNIVDEADKLKEYYLRLIR